MEKKLQVSGLALIIFAALNIWFGKTFAGYSDEVFVRGYFEFLAIAFGLIGFFTLGAYALRLVIKSYHKIDI